MMARAHPKLALRPFLPAETPLVEEGALAPVSKPPG